ncbi:protein xmas-2 [Drosophila eugracilis]|uniref:protein xmas-2 n=1 Tax=Drosophila eugracilis TaxID=29029 RepID=UPI0007E7B078|nr:protein xmas-2 [Drosophila eugracilis]
MAENRPGAYNYKTLLCTHIPELFLDKFVARSHFGRFGNLMNFVLHPRRMTCTVSYATEDEAERALHEGGTFQGHRFEMSYAENETTPAQKTEEWVDPDVQAELSALQSGWRNEYAPGKPSKPAPGGAPANTLSSSAIVTKNPPAARERPAVQQRDLESMMRRPAHTSEERYRVLDARDKLLRINQSQRKLTGATQGYCPDMCPEKERLLREFQRQVAIYELQRGSNELICHERAIKQYSRSSADQETPLPHELRNETALHMTMTYLMHEIMDISERQESQLGDWFHFVWDRTRSIRKEITQQELCSLGAVKLVEQCARFHIHCTARLVAADPSIFDSKINAENLTKCLQTLKYMYHDLRLKGVQCPREPEFRGYIVLLNLADANFLWDISQLPAELQSCPEVRQAIQFHLALQDTNFVRFFQMVMDKETSYLSACILVTYFTHLRVHALRRLLLAYRHPRRDEVASLPLAYITDMLSFASDQEASDFVQHYGVEVTDAGNVALNPMPTVDTDYKLSRQFELVESKRQQSVGEVICGEPLPPRDLYLNHQPHNSFNQHGVLKSIAWAAKDQLPGMQQEPMQPQNPPQPPAVSNQSENFFKVPMQPNGMTAGLAAPGTMGVQPAVPSGGFSFVLPKSPAQELQDQAMAEQYRRKLEEAKHQALQQAIAAAKEREAELMAIQEAKLAEAERLRQEKARKFQEEQRRKQEEKQRQQEQERLQLELERRKELERLRQVELQEKETREKAMALECYQDIYHDSLVEICKREFQLHNKACRIYESVLDVLTRRLIEQEMKQSIRELGIMRTYVRRWRNYGHAQHKKDTLFNQLPLSFGAVNPTLLVDERNVESSMRLIIRYRLGEPCNYGTLLTGLEERSWLKLDLWRVLSQCLPQKQPGARRFYKLVLNLPGSKVGFHLSYVLDRGLLQEPQDTGSQLAKGGYIRALSHGIGLSVVKVRGNSPELESADMANANGIICFAEKTDLPHLPQRLKQLMRVSHCRDVALIVEHPADKVYDETDFPYQHLELRSFRAFPFKKSGKARERLMTEVQAAVKFLAKTMEKSVRQFHEVEISEFLLENLVSELFGRLKHAAEQDEAFKVGCQLYPQFCVRLFNEAIDRLQSVAGEDMSDCQQFPEELRVFVQPQPIETPLPTNRLEYFEPGWHLSEQRQRIVQLLENCRLPNVPKLKMSSTPSEAHCLWVLEYTQKTQCKERVDEVALQGSQILQSNDNDLGFLNFMEYLAGERLQYILGQETNLPKRIVYDMNSMKKHFLGAWYFQTKVPQLFISNVQDCPEVEDEYENMKPPHRINKDLDYYEVMSKAEAVLSRFRKREEERFTLRDNNGSFANRKSTSKPNQTLDTENNPKRMRRSSDFN